MATFSSIAITPETLNLLKEFRARADPQKEIRNWDDFFLEWINQSQFLLDMEEENAR